MNRFPQSGGEMREREVYSRCSEHQMRKEATAHMAVIGNWREPSPLLPSPLDKCILLYFPNSLNLLIKLLYNLNASQAAFSFASPSVWNGLSEFVKSSESINFLNID